MCPVRLHRAFRWGLAFGRDRLLWRDVVESEAPSYLVFFVTLARSSFTPAAISGLKSSASQIGRISRSLGPGIGLGHRLAHSTASSIDRTCQIQNPATSSFVSAKGPSVTDRLVPLKWIRFPNLLGLSPSPASMIPALTSSSLNLPICANISSVPSISKGCDAASESLVAFTSTMTRIGPPLWLRAALVACSTPTSFGGTGNRHHVPRKNSVAHWSLTRLPTSIPRGRQTPTCE